MNPNVNYGLWVTMMHRCRFINCNNCITRVGNVDDKEGYVYVLVCVGGGVYGKSLYLLLNMSVNLKLLYKSSLNKK